VSTPRKGSASGKIILSGEYAVVFGKPGIAVPAKERIEVTWTDDLKKNEVEIVWAEIESRLEWATYIRKILSFLQSFTGPLKGTLTINNTIPLGKGMGSSTALVIAMCRCFLGPQCAKVALSIENEMTLGNSGLDFAVIWEEKPIYFEHNKEPHIVALPAGLLSHTELIDTGTPNETTAELVAWVKNRYESGSVNEAIETIGTCTERLLKGEDLKTVMRDHHRAQVALGVVPEVAQQLISDIETAGGAAKVIGAGARTGGGGMVLAIR
jgi:mevalonate kinase